MKHCCITENNNKLRFQLPILPRLALSNCHLFWFFIFLLSLILQASGQVPVWDFDRRQIADGAFWLLISGNVVHLNWMHWALNMSGLAIVAFFFSNYSTVTHWAALTLVSSFFVGLGLYRFNPELTTYVGFSGTLHGLFIYGAYCEIKKYPLSGYALLVVVIGKLIWEIFYGALPGSENLTRGHVATDAHLYGAIGGGFYIMCLYLLDQLVKIKNR